MLICERHHDYLLEDIFLVLQRKSYLKQQFFILQCKYLLLGLQWQIIDTNRNQRTSAFSTKLTVQIIVICGSQPYIHSYQTCLVFTDDCNLKRKTTKGQIKPKADWRAKDSPKKRTNKFDCKFQVFRDCKAKNQN